MVQSVLGERGGGKLRVFRALSAAAARLGAVSV
jgi:hypothetical protein